MKVWLASLLLGAMISIVASSELNAQVSRPGVGERDRGILNRLGARRDDRRDDRLGRNAPTPAPANTPANNTRGSDSRGNNSTLPASAAAGRPSGTNPAATKPTGANQAGAAVVAAGYSGSNQVSAPGSLAGSLPPNRLPYLGPGVVIHLPERLRGEVNYLINDSEHLILQSGQIHHLAVAARYEVRFSRGVTSEGRSYGEARYVVSEGVYRFDVSDKGWELYREGEANEVQNVVQQAQQRAAGMLAGDSVPLIPADASLAREGALPQATSPISDSDRATAQSWPSATAIGGDQLLPSPTPSTIETEETLPVPKSILEPGL